MTDQELQSDDDNPSQEPARDPEPGWLRRAWADGWLRQVTLSVAGILITAVIVWIVGQTVSSSISGTIDEAADELEQEISKDVDKAVSGLKTEMGLQGDMLDRTIAGEARRLDEKIVSQGDLLNQKIDSHSELLTNQIINAEKQLEARLDGIQDRLSGVEDYDSMDVEAIVEHTEETQEDRG